MTSPKINVTPLIDVLLVLLIIFMVISPLKPSSFQARIPSEPRPFPRASPPPEALVVAISRDLSLSLNAEKSLGSVDEPENLVSRLRSVFDQRRENGAVDEHGDVQKTVFIRAPKTIGYGNVVKVIDAVKMAGAEPLSLQIDYLE
jgi:biopolymer transport protein ExbD